MNQGIKKEIDLIKEGVLKATAVEAIYLFGSYAYGTPNDESDIDIYVVVPDDAPDLSELKASVLKNTRHKRSLPMDLLMGRSSVFNKRINGPTLEKVIAQKGIMIHGI